MPENSPKNSFVAADHLRVQKQSNINIHKMDQDVPVQIPHSQMMPANVIDPNEIELLQSFIRPLPEYREIFYHIKYDRKDDIAAEIRKGYNR
ncbi:MAG: hypothetical protein ACMX3H_04930 [Sodalis sp. (in: enterobacteria)]|uniref:hypothetical protein n=1 Tax=Sodalis sp. (in: enterobacteria) TaxID=1898979 RepID=UPI0039E41CAA